MAAMMMVVVIVLCPCVCCECVFYLIHQPPSILLPSVVGVPHRPNETLTVCVKALRPLPFRPSDCNNVVLNCPPETVLGTTQLLPLGVGFDDRLGMGQFAFAVSLGCDSDGHRVALVSLL